MTVTGERVVAADAVVPGRGVVSAARIAARADGRGGTCLPVLTAEGALAVRRVRGPGSGAGALLVGAMGGPLGGDRTEVEVDVGEGALLRVGSAAATLALPGQSGGRAQLATRLRVATDGELRWLPEQLIAARGSDLHAVTRIELAEGARLVWREEQVLGRSGEQPGRLHTRLDVRHGQRALLAQELACGTGIGGGWDGPAVFGGLRTTGQLLVVRPEFGRSMPEPAMLGEHAALSPLPGPAVLVTAVAADARELRRVLDGALDSLVG